MEKTVMNGIDRKGSADSLSSISNTVTTGTNTVHIPAGTAAWCWAMRDLEGPALVILPDRRVLAQFVADWEQLVPEKDIQALSEIPLSKELIINDAIRMERGCSTMKWLASGDLMAATAPAVMAPLLLPSERIEIGEGIEAGRDVLLEWALASGYERSDLVWQEGQFVSRGSIVDLFDPSYRYPLRIEFFDDRVESIRIFDPATQRNISPVGVTKLLSLKRGTRKTFQAMIPPSAKIIFVERRAISRSAEAYKWLWDGIAGNIGIDSLEEWEKVEYGFRSNRSFHLTKAIEGSSYRLDISEIPSFRGKLDAAESFVRGWKNDGFHVTVLSSSDLMLEWAGINGVVGKRGNISGGFCDRTEKKVFLSDSDLTGIVPVISRGKVTRIPPREWEERIEDQDYVVHEDYGIARNLGIERISSGGMDRDCLVLQFAENRRLMMPLVQLFKISPYPLPVGEDRELDSLRGKAWKKNAAKARERAKEAARQIISLYAARESASKIPFPPDGELMRVFEKGFPFIETADQISAIKAVKKDMENSFPMERLLVGDVGFGKTEVAFRAAIKAAESGKQTLFLVPTTLLASQHYESFISRITGLPVRSEVLSRFVPKKRQDEVKRDLESGLVDVVFGTHKLLQGDLKVKNLGLIIIDEEHRFGVLHKERLKKIDPSVDVLSISATPIPRTLQMALGGLRSISVISTPPHNRMQVMTYAGPWRDDLFRESVIREIARGGQVFYVHNRIESIEKVASGIRRQFPGVVVDIAHGRMDERALEEAMSRFASRETDLLVCTTIIESGLDLPGANTLVVDNAQDLGLAQMYQLRGRVGRREAQAYALFFYPADVSLPREAMERLEAIAGMDGDEGGFALARRDMEIRGGGQIAGTRQHGHAEKVGYHSYFKMLEEEISLASDKKTVPVVKMDIRLPVVLPSTYVPQSSVRIVIFRRLLKVSDIKETEELKNELRERFGPLPQSVEFMLASAVIRTLGAYHGLQYVRCSLKETCAAVDVDHPSRLPRRAGWMQKANGTIVGPGGYRGMLELAGMIEVSEEVKTEARQ